MTLEYIKRRKNIELSEIENGFLVEIWNPSGGGTKYWFAHTFEEAVDNMVKIFNNEELWTAQDEKSPPPKQ